jgi:hypothetical protein
LIIFDFAGQYGRSKDLLGNDEVYQGSMEDSELMKNGQKTKTLTNFNVNMLKTLSNFENKFEC